jgi:hypothetical protein
MSSLRRRTTTSSRAFLPQTLTPRVNLYDRAARGASRFPRLRGRRNDSELLDRALEDTLFLGRAHSLGWRRQQVEMLGWALI